MEEERRKAILTREDLEAIGEEVASRLPVCSLGLTTSEASMIKGHLGFYRKACNIVGTVLVTALVVFVLGVFTKGFWVAIADNLGKK